MSTISRSPGFLAVAGSLPTLLTPSHSPSRRRVLPNTLASQGLQQPLGFFPRHTQGAGQSPSGRHPSQPLPGRPGLTTPASTTYALRENKSGGPPPKAWLARPLGMMPYHGVARGVWGTGGGSTPLQGRCAWASGARPPQTTPPHTPPSTRHNRKDLRALSLSRTSVRSPRGPPREALHQCLSRLRGLTTPTSTTYALGAPLCHRCIAGEGGKC